MSRRLHIGCGAVILPGWINVDLESHPGVDHVLDVREGLPYRNVSHIFAEHFLEHLTEEEGAAFLRGCRSALAASGTLRISTPNLDWVMATHYDLNEKNPLSRIEQCRVTNRAFHGWGHKFLYNDTLLRQALFDAGFAHVSFHRYGDSNDPILNALEQHPNHGDLESMQHVVIAEARLGLRLP